MARRLVIAYSPDRALTAEVLGKALENGRYHEKPIIEYREVEGRGLLRFYLDYLEYEEDEFPHVVMRLMQGPPDPCDWRENCGLGYEG